MQVQPAAVHEHGREQGGPPREPAERRHVHVVGELEGPRAEQVVPALERDAPARQEELDDEHRHVGGDERHGHGGKAPRLVVVVQRDHRKASLPADALRRRERPVPQPPPAVASPDNTRGASPTLGQGEAPLKRRMTSQPWWYRCDVGGGRHARDDAERPAASDRDPAPARGVLLRAAVGAVRRAATTCAWSSTGASASAGAPAGSAAPAPSRSAAATGSPRRKPGVVAAGHAVLGVLTPRPYARRAGACRPFHVRSRLSALRSSRSPGSR